jgi:DNA adenine methylase
MAQIDLFQEEEETTATPDRPKGQLLKWVGNKYRHAETIVSHFPANFRRYFEPFVGTGAILGTLNPRAAIVGDTLTPLVDLWHLVQNDPERVSRYYKLIIEKYEEDREGIYNGVLNQFNENPNGLDLLILSRTCYGGVLRFRKDGKMSTPIGSHSPISPEKFTKRLWRWHRRVKSTFFLNEGYKKTLKYARAGDLIYCDPPYVDSQSILYGSQDFSLQELLGVLSNCKARGARVALSIDGTKKSGEKEIELSFPTGLFERELFIEGGSSMLKRFQSGGEIMEGEDVSERLLFSW